MRSVVFRTPGKLDLRSITVFGLNAKPNSSNPIGYFGTGLKYSIAVLARHNLKTTIWIGDTKWTVETDPTKFRNKDFKSIQLRRHRKTLGIGKRIELPFTTELGKTWELWQAFRELYANTLDEQGETFLCDLTTDGVMRVQGVTLAPKQCTHIIVEGEEFVQEYLEREKTFLPDALRQQPNEEPVQRFDRPSKFIYWRGMRVHDLREPSEFTWNILAPIDLTEDRTAKYEFQLRTRIEEYLRNHAPKDVIQQAITSPYGKFEHRLSFDYHYTAPSSTFIEAVKDAPQDQLNIGAKGHAASYMPKEPPKIYTKEELYDRAIEAITNGSWGLFEEAIEFDREWFIELLRLGKEAWDGQQPMYEVVDPFAEDEACVDCGQKGECADGCPQRIPDPVPSKLLEDNMPF